MAQTLLLRGSSGPARRDHAARHDAGLARRLQDADPAAAARGILLALALSALAWITLALAVPRLW